MTDVWFEETTQDNVCTLTLTQPTMPPAFFDAVGDTFRALATRSDLRAVVLRSQCKHFSYGLDLPKTFASMGPLFTGAGLAAPRTELMRIIRRWQDCFTAVAELPMPVIAALHGWCIGGGLDLTSAADIRLASADTRISLREAKIGIVADLGSLQRLPGIIGRAHTRELAYTAGDIDAERAAAIGLVNHVYADRDAVHAAADAMARQIAANPPLTIQGVKDVLRYGEGKTVQEGLEYVSVWNSAFLQSEDLAEAISAYMAKRAPTYKGK